MLGYRTRKRALFCLLLAVVGALGGAACSSGPSLEQACTDYATIVRARESTCYGVAVEPDESTLVAREIEACVLSTGAPGSNVDASYWEGCAEAADNQCGSYQCPTYPAGALADGEPCLAATQCAGLWCKGNAVLGSGTTALPGAIQCGTCATRLVEDASCDPATDACASGLSCYVNRCRVQGVQGEPCDVWSDCAFPWVCKSTGVCDTVNADGDACSTSLDCGTDTGCDIPTKLCDAVRYAQAGGACDGAVQRCEAGYCDIATNTCPTVLTDGSACDPTDPAHACRNYALCFEGTCTIPDPATCK